jgi:hypothetical protein
MYNISFLYTWTCNTFNITTSYTHIFYSMVVIFSIVYTILYLYNIIYNCAVYSCTLVVYQTGEGIRNK